MLAELATYSIQDLNEAYTVAARTVQRLSLDNEHTLAERYRDRLDGLTDEFKARHSAPPKLAPYHD